MPSEDRPADLPPYVLMPEDLPTDGVDRTLVRFALRMTPAERLDHARGLAASLGALADAAEAAGRTRLLACSRLTRSW